MKQRISILIDVEILRQAKQQSAEVRRSLSDLIQKALFQYLSKDKATPSERKRAYHLFCEQPMKYPRASSAMSYKTMCCIDEFRAGRAGMTN